MDFEFTQFSYGEQLLNFAGFISSNEEDYMFDLSKIPSLNPTEANERSESLSINEDSANLNLSSISSSKSISSTTSKSIDNLRLDQMARCIIVQILKKILSDINDAINVQIYREFKKDIKFAEFSNKKVKKKCISQKLFPLFLEKTPFDLLTNEDYFDSSDKFKQEINKVNYLLSLKEYGNKEGSLFKLINSPMIFFFNKYLNDFDFIKSNLSELIPKFNDVFDYLLKRHSSLRKQLSLSYKSKIL